MRMRIAVAAAGLAALCAPVGAVAKPVKGQHKKALYTANERQAYEVRYLDVRERYVDELGVREAGRDIVRDGFRGRGGEVRPASRSEVVRSTERMVAVLSAPDPAPEAEATTGTPAEAAVAGAAGSMSGTVQCESGGDYSAVNPAGYYGAYQFDQQTWDAYAPEGYAGTNPAQAPPAVQDAAAANVDYDAWPNC
jgi:hypothetical protein